ncbi:MAG TPA: acyloxyacyl hydrolase [Bacteroidales bacterium]|nr:acyloxyacyl hydrolase [Bacteroidales bacterium]
MKKASVCITLLSLIFIQTATSATLAEVDSTHHKNTYLYSVLAQSGQLMPTWSFMREKYRTDGEEFGDFNSLSFQILKQTYGEKPIEQIFHFPRYGIGIYAGKYFRDTYLSRPLGMYGVFMGPILEWNRFCLNYCIWAGIIGNWNHYDPAKNNFNTTLAGDFTSHVDVGLQLNYKVSAHFEAGIGGAFTHFSNGAMQIPNFGINMLAPRVSVTYLPVHSEQKKIKRTLPKYVKSTFLDLAVYGGEKELPYPECDLDTAHNFFGFHYPQFGLTAVLNRNISYVITMGMGLHVGYDSSKNTRYRQADGQTVADLSFNAENLNLGIIPSLELNYDRIALVLQPCFTVYKHETTFKKPDFFGKFGLKYALSDNIYAGVQLHTFKLHADFIEFSFGYRLPLFVN